MTIYDKPVKSLMHEFAEARLSKGQVFDKNDAMIWFKERYPRIKPGTVQMHVEAMSVNSPFRKHHPNVRPGSGHDLFYKVRPGSFRLWEPETDPRPWYRDQLINAEPDLEHSRAPSGGDSSSQEDSDSDVESREFAFETDLRNRLAKNLETLESGLKLYDEEGFSGVEFPVGGRFIDILAVDSNGALVVIELKVSRGYDRVIGQLLGYMGWVQKNLASGKQVRGIIVASGITEDLQLAASLVANVHLFEYELTMKLKPLKT